MQEERTRARILARKQEKEAALMDKAARIGAIRRLSSAHAQLRKAAQQVGHCGFWWRQGMQSCGMGRAVSGARHAGGSAGGATPHIQVQPYVCAAAQGATTACVLVYVKGGRGEGRLMTGVQRAHMATCMGCTHGDPRRATGV